MKQIQRIFFLSLSLLPGKFLSAAWVVSYTMTPSQPAYVAITGTAGVTSIANFSACPDQSVSQVIPFGFTFNFDGTNYTQCVVTENGLLIFGNQSALSTCGGNVGTPTDIPNDLSDVNIPRPFLAPLWEELQFKPTSPFGSGSYITTGSAPNRIFTFEWNKMSWRSPTNGDQVSFQVKLYEGTNIIDFNYIQGASALGTLPTASIGLGAIAPGTYYSLNNSSSAPVVSSSVNTSSISSKPANNQQYRWAPTGSLPIGLISFTGHNEDAVNVLNWTTATQTNNDYFTLYHSGDGVSFTQVARVDGAGTTSERLSYSDTDANPAPGVTYYKLEWTDFNGLRDHSPYIAIISDTVGTAYIFPNPASTTVNVGTLNRNTLYEIRDAEGRLIFKGEMEKSGPYIDVSGLADGIYYLQLNGKVTKLVVEHE
jgi:hypothetical protein